ncbi:MAG: hypothetical protein ACREPL_03450, partial [Rhodanobacteraceae bacterium]
MHLRGHRMATTPAATAPVRTSENRVRQRLASFVLGWLCHRGIHMNTNANTAFSSVPEVLLMLRAPGA